LCIHVPHSFSCIQLHVIPLSRAYYALYPVCMHLSPGVHEHVYMASKHLVYCVSKHLSHLVIYAGCVRCLVDYPQAFKGYFHELVISSLNLRCFFYCISKLLVAFFAFLQLFSILVLLTLQPSGFVLYPQEHIRASCCRLFARKFRASASHGRHRLSCLLP